jgi:alanyl-tRNA synthetase
MLDLNIEQIAKESIRVSGINFVYKLVQNLDTKVLRLSAQQIVDKSDNLVIVYIGMPDLQGKLSITIAISKEISNKVHAGNLAKEVSVFLGGSGGGGQANIAQAGGTGVSKVGKLQDMIRELLSKF